MALARLLFEILHVTMDRANVTVVEKSSKNLSWRILVLMQRLWFSRTCHLLQPYWSENVH